MLKYFATTISNKIFELLSPAKVSINRSLDAPADELVAIFPLSEDPPELRSINVLNEENKSIFFGPLDIQEYNQNSSGSFLTLSARNRVAFLLDNEALPEIYTLPSLELIFKRHLLPYGFKGFLGSKKTFAKEFKVTKGMSEYEVIETFCKDFLGVFPRFIDDEILDSTGTYKEGSVVFSNEIEGGQKYSAIKESIKRHKQYSELFIKTSKDTTYSLNIKNSEAISKGILKKRYLNIENSQSTPIAYDERILKASNKNSYEIALTCPGSFTLNVGDIAFVKDSFFKNQNQRFIVYKTQYILSSLLEKTDVTLIKEA